MSVLHLKEEKIMRNFWKMKSHRIIMFSAFACLLAAGICLKLFQNLNDQDVDQSAAHRWQSGEQEFAQISVFLSPQENWTEADRKMLLSQIRMAFQENSITNESERGGDEALITDCYSYETKMTLTNGKNTAEAAVIATGGDFFYFHPQLWLSGYAYSEKDAMQDRIVLDKELAWNLFGSSNVEGMSLKINDKTYYVAGTVDRKEDSADKAAYGESNRAWISYSTLVSAEQKPPITCYEIVMPNPVSGWAKEILSQSLMPEQREITVLENSSRADFFQVFQDIGKFAKRTMVTKAVKYPYWENASRIRDTYRELYLFLAVLFVIYPCGLCIVGIVRLYQFLCRALPQLKERFS